MQVFARAHFGIIRGFFSHIAFLCAGFQHGFGFGQVGQPLLTKSDFCFDTEAGWQ